MGEIAVRQAILHGVIAAGFVEALLRVWRIRRAESRLAFWVLALAFPFLVLPVFLVAAPFRTDDAFMAGSALFSSNRWNAMRLARLSVDTLVFGILALSGTLLFLRDLVPFLIQAARGHREEASVHAAPPDGLVTRVAELACRAGIRTPAVTVLRTDASVLFVRGLLRPTLVLSNGVLTQLSDGGLQAAIVHELAHVRFRDPLAGWLLMAARLVMFWNPAVQLMSRAIVQEMEHRADRMAVRLADAPGLVTAFRTLTSARSADRPSVGEPRRTLNVFAERLHHAQMSARLASLTERQSALRFARTRMVLVAATLGVLLFFVV